MIYELWNVCSLTSDEPQIPFSLLYQASTFEAVYTKFREIIIHQPCVIFVRTITSSVESESN